MFKAMQSCGIEGEVEQAAEKMVMRRFVVDAAVT